MEMGSSSEIPLAIANVRERMAAAVATAGLATTPRLVAVSKTKPASLIMEAYEGGQRVFGENYVQELMEKAPELPDDIEWHFIGHLQSRKVKGLIGQVPNLAMLETVDSTKLADALNKACEREEPLRVMIQVNTSGEESKNGVTPEECGELAKHVHTNCPKLKLCGVMTIGQPDYTSRPENFECLAKCRADMAVSLGILEEELELSMGMSGDFEAAIAMGSTNVRVGSTIFGSRS